MFRIEYRDLGTEQVLFRIIECTEEDIKAMPFTASNGVSIYINPGDMWIGHNFLDVGGPDCRKKYKLRDTSTFLKLKAAVREFNNRNNPAKTSGFFEIAE